MTTIPRAPSQRPAATFSYQGQPAADLRSAPKSALCAFLFGIDLSILITTLFVWCSIGLLLGCYLPLTSVALACATSAVVHTICARRWLGSATGIASLATAALVMAAILAAAFVALRFFDTSCDGPGYHQPAIMTIARGWNPYHDPPLPDGRYETLWINHYPKASWMIGALLLSATGHIELGKCVGMLLALGCAALAYANLRIGGWRTGRSACFAAVLALNPVCIYQSQSFYVDGLLASALLSIALLSVAAIVTRSALIASLVALEVIFLVNLKFTGVLYACALLVVIAASSLFVAGSRRVAVAIAIGLAIGTVGLGFNPYCDNFIRKGHPFYPLQGSGSVDIIGQQLPTEFIARDRVTKLLWSTFSRSSNDLTKPPRLKVPGTLVMSEIESLRATDLRVAGFGPLFALALLLALAAFGQYCWQVGRARPARGDAVIILFASLFVVGSALANPEGWWARYCPQLWWLPIGCGVCCMAVPSWRIRGVAIASIAILGANVALVGTAYFAFQTRESSAIRRQLVELSTRASETELLQGGQAAEERLTEAKVSWRAAKGPCGSPVELRDLPAQVCLGGH